MGHFFITGPEREHPFHASNVRGRRDLKANPKMSEEYRNVRGEFGLLPSTNKRRGSVSHAPRTHVPLHSRSADTHLTPKMSEEHCNEGTNPKMSEEFR